MAIIQITKIQIRRGPEADLPGAPTSLDPLIFSQALESGEFGFASDTGRLFIGHDPQVGQANYARPVFPFQNVEVLTENSVETINRIVSRVLRGTGREAFITAALPTTTGDDWNVVTVTPETGSPFPFRFTGPYVNATIDYSVYTTANEPVRNGSLRVLHPGDNTEPSVTDDATSLTRLELGGASNYDAATVYGSLRFRFSIVSTGGVDYYQFEYQNKIAVALKLFFRHTRVVP